MTPPVPGNTFVPGMPDAVFARPDSETPTGISPFTREVIAMMKAVPAGKVATYGQIARLCGNPRGARQVSRILHSCSGKHDLPWHRIVNAQGGISLGGDGAALQRSLLENEGVRFSREGKIDLNRYQW